MMTAEPKKDVPRPGMGIPTPGTDLRRPGKTGMKPRQDAWRPPDDQDQVHDRYPAVVTVKDEIKTSDGSIP